MRYDLLHLPSQTKIGSAGVGDIIKTSTINIFLNKYEYKTVINILTISAISQKSVLWQIYNLVYQYNIIILPSYWLAKLNSK